MRSELAGTFFEERGARNKSLYFLMHSARYYEKWGASSVAKRVEASVAAGYGSEFLAMASPSGEDSSRAG